MNTKTLALLCRFCPACRIARRFPNSGFAKKMIEAEKNCPACNAYRQLYGWPTGKK